MDSGNFSDNPTAKGDIKTRSLVEGMSRMGYSVANVGDRDLVLGYDEFRSRTEGASFPFISTNIVRRDTQEPVFEPYVVLEAEKADGSSVRVGVLGVVRFSPVFLKSGPEGSNLVIARPVDMVRRYLPEVRERSDIVVLLTAIHQDDARLIVREVPGIDLVLGSYGAVYSHRDDAEGGAHIVYTGNQGKRIGESRVFLGEQNEIGSTSTFIYNLTANYPDDPEMAEFVQGVQGKLNELASRKDKARQAGRAGASYVSSPDGRAQDPS